MTTLSTYITHYITGGASRGGVGQYGADPGSEGVQPGVDPRDLGSAAVAVAHDPNLSESSLLLHKERSARVSLTTVPPRPAGTQRDVLVAEGDQVTVISPLS